MTLFIATNLILAINFRKLQFLSLQSYLLKGRAYMAQSNTIRVTVNYNILKHLHELFLAKAAFLEARQANLENVEEEITSDWFPFEFNNSFIYDIKDFFKANFSSAQWKYHHDHFLIVTELFLRDEFTTKEFKKDRKDRLIDVAEKIKAIESILKQESLEGATILKQNGTSIDISVIDSKVLKYAKEELLALYQRNLIDGNLPLQPDQETLKPRKSGRFVHPQDIAIGHLALVLKAYLEEIAGMKAMEKTNFKGKTTSISLSNEQGELICAYFILLKIIPEPASAYHITIRRAIERYIQYIETNYQFQESLT